MKLRKLFVVVLLLISVIALAGCKKGDKDTLVVCLGPNPATIDPALNSSVDGATMIIHAFTGLVGYQQNDKGALELVPELVTELPVPTKLQDGKYQYVFTLKDDLKWSDGSKLDANDFVYAWNRAVNPNTAADYAYMFDVVDGYNAVTEVDDDGNIVNPNAKLNVTASADGKKLTVILSSNVPYFFELLAFPTYMPVKKSVVDAEPDKWATEVDTYIGNGPYKMIEWVQDSKIVFEKNPNYHNADAVKIKKIEFALSDDDGAILANYKNGTYKLIDSVPNDEISSLRKEYKDEFIIAGQLGTYYLNFNVNDLSIYDDKIVTTEEERQKVRLALSLLIDRNYIADEIGQAGQLPANSFVPIGLTEPDGKTEFIAKNGPKGDGAGYYSVENTDEAYAANCAEAIKLLQEVGYTFDTKTKKFTNFPSFYYITNTGTGHQAIANYLQSLYSGYGIIMSIVNQEWGVFLETRKQGNYTVARNGWLGDYNDPISFLDMWTSTSGNNDVQFGKDAHANVKIYGKDKNQSWAETYDKLIEQIKSSSDPVKRFELMHQAEDMLMTTGAIVPIYYYTDLYMVSPDLKGFFASPLGYKFLMYAELK